MSTNCGPGIKKLYIIMVVILKRDNDYFLKFPTNNSVCFEISVFLCFSTSIQSKKHTKAFKSLKVVKIKVITNKSTKVSLIKLIKRAIERNIAIITADKYKLLQKSW